MGTSGGYSVYEDPSTFYVAVAEFIEEEDNERFQGDIVFKGDDAIEVRGDLNPRDGVITTEKRAAVETLSFGTSCIEACSP